MLMRDTLSPLCSVDYLLTYKQKPEQKTVNQIPIEIIEEKDLWLVKAYLPNINKKDIKVNITSDNVLCIEALRSRPPNIFLSDLYYGEIKSSVKLNCLTNNISEEIKAEYKEGVLFISIFIKKASLSQEILID